jgi:hypothetical protein
MLGAKVVIAKGCVTPGDKGGGLFYWDPSSSASDNGGTVIGPVTIDPTCIELPGRWIRIYDGLIDVHWFGARGDSATDDTKALQAALAEVRVRGGSLFFPPGRYIVTATLDAGASQGIRYMGGCSTARGSSSAEDGSLAQWPTTLVWMGGQAERATSDVLFKWGGSHCIFDGLGFQGGWDSAPNPQELRSDGKDARCWNGSQPRMDFTRCRGISVRRQRDDDNGDMCSFGRIHVKDARSAFASRTIRLWSQHLLRRVRQHRCVLRL